MLPNCLQLLFQLLLKKKKKKAVFLEQDVKGLQCERNGAHNLWFFLVVSKWNAPRCASAGSVVSTLFPFMRCAGSIWVAIGWVSQRCPLLKAQRQSLGYIMHKKTIKTYCWKLIQHQPMRVATPVQKHPSGCISSSLNALWKPLLSVALPIILIVFCWRCASLKEKKKKKVEMYVLIIIFFFLNWPVISKNNWAL